MELMRFGSLAFVVLLICCFSSAAFGDEPKFAIAIHGGAGSAKDAMSAEAAASREKSMTEALTIGTKILSEGGTSLDAVEAVIVFLENDPKFNAGKGAVLNAKGKHELDASIMNGENLQCGAVAGVSTIKNPIVVARRVMTDTRHVLLAAAGAEAFADSLGSEIERVENVWFTTPKRAKQRERMLKKDAVESSTSQTELSSAKCDYMGTVGCVALDSHGNLAAGTSTGGMSNKKFGRVGDSPIVGAGTYADNKTCAVSGTGIGEQYIRNAVAYNVAAQMQYGKASLVDALKDNLENRLDPADGGLIGVDKDGNIATGTNTGGMLRGVADGKGRFEVSW
jgi:beta-aspartyl-peptidase (threonine type)